MSHLCSYCKKNVEKDVDFILEGKYPGLRNRFIDHQITRTLHRGLGHWGELYHKNCFFEKNSKEKK
jgi:hypothetical protein